jgi:hypothetical protein
VVRGSPRVPQVIQGGCYRSDDEIAENGKRLADLSFCLLWHPILRRAFDDYFASAPLMAGCVDDQVLRPAFDWRLRQAAREDCENEHAPEETKKEQRPMLDSRRIFRMSV